MRDNNFDLIRLFAAMQVVVFHGIEHLKLRESIPFWLYELIGIFPGVPIFFFISGFLISAAFLRSSSLRQYAVNRVLRIFPGLWVCFAFGVITVLVFSPFSLFNANLFELLAWVAAQLSIGQFFNPEFLRSYGVGALNGSLWTIPVEIQFYLSIPVLLALLKNNKISKKCVSWILSFLILAFLLINQFFHAGWIFNHSETLNKLFAVSFIPYFWIFLIGVLVQLNFGKIQVFFEEKAGYWALAYGLCVGIILSFGLTPGTNFPHPLAALCLCGLVLSVAFTKRHLANSLLAKNDISYGVYIYHMLIVNVLIHLHWTGRSFHLVLLLLVTTLLGLLSWLFIEKPNLARQTRLARWLQP